MGLRIATNAQSIAAQRTLGTQRNEQNHQLEKLASGERIVRAADDAAGLAISEKFKAEIRSTRQATRNAQDAISLVQVAEGGLNEVGNMLIRMRELSVQAASDTVGDQERNFVDREIQALKSEINRITESTQYNGITLLDGGVKDKEKNPDGLPRKLEFQVGVGSSPQRDRIEYDTATANASLEALGITLVSTTTKEFAQSNLDTLDKAINAVSSNRAGFGALQNRLQSTINNLMISDENLSAANSRIRDADVALETAELTKRNILTQAGVSTLAQANSNGMLALKLI